MERGAVKYLGSQWELKKWGKGVKRYRETKKIEKEQGYKER